jgi:hypothetical protein
LFFGAGQTFFWFDGSGYKRAVEKKVFCFYVIKNF